MKSENNILNRRSISDRKKSNTFSDSMKIFVGHAAVKIEAHFIIHLKKKTKICWEQKQNVLWMKPEGKKNKSVNLSEDMKDHFNYAIKWFSGVIYDSQKLCVLSTKNWRWLQEPFYWFIEQPSKPSRLAQGNVLFPLLLFQFLFESRYGISRSGRWSSRMMLKWCLIKLISYGI